MVAWFRMSPHSPFADLALKADANTATLLHRIATLKNGRREAEEALFTYALAWTGDKLTHKIPRLKALQRYTQQLDQDVLAYELGCFFFHLVNQHIENTDLKGFDYDSPLSYDVVMHALTLFNEIAQDVKGWKLTRNLAYNICENGYKEGDGASQSVQIFVGRLIAIKGLTCPAFRHSEQFATTLMTLSIDFTSEAYVFGHTAAESFGGYVDSYLNLLRLMNADPPVDDRES